MSPQGPQGSSESSLAVEEGHALCWPDPKEMEATWLLRQPSCCVEDRGSLVVYGWVFQILRLLPGTPKGIMFQPWLSCLVVGHMGSHRIQLAPAFICAVQEGQGHRGHCGRHGNVQVPGSGGERNGRCRKKHNSCVSPSERLS